MQPCNKEYVPESFKNFKSKEAIEIWKKDLNNYEMGIEMLYSWQREYSSDSFRFHVIQEQIDFFIFNIEGIKQLIEETTKELEENKI